MFALGFEESTDNFIDSVKKSWGIALFGALGPFAVAYVITDYIWNDPNISLMSAFAMTATAVSLTTVSLQSEGLQRSVVATRIMTSAVIDDIGALVAVAIMVPLATGQESLSRASIALTGGKAGMFFVVVMDIAYVQNRILHECCGATDDQMVAALLQYRGRPIDLSVALIQPS